MFNWSNELRRFCPSLTVLRVHTNDSSESTRIRGILRTEGHKLHVVLTTYEMLKSQYLAQPLKMLIYRGVILDEGHRIRHEDTVVSKACFSLRSTFRLVLTGTPLQNNLKEAGVLLSFLAPNIFTDMALFDNAFNLNHGKGTLHAIYSTYHSLDYPLLCRT